MSIDRNCMGYPFQPMMPFPYPNIENNIEQRLANIEKRLSILESNLNNQNLNSNMMNNYQVI